VAAKEYNFSINRRVTPVERCIYCGQTGKLTKEHIYGRWMRKFITQDIIRTNHYTSFREQNPDSGEPIGTLAKGKLNRSGGPHSGQLQIVCQKCNGGWMSKIQDEAKPYLEKLLNGIWPKFTGTEHITLARWVKMVTISIEYADQTTKTVRESERKKFMDDQDLSQNWYIFIGLCQPNGSVGEFWHRGAGLHFPPEEIPSAANFQTTTINLRNSFVHSISGEDRFLPELEEYTRTLGIRRLWPISERIKEPPLIYTIYGVNRVATAYWTGIGSSPEPHFGMFEHPR
jgi:hypothetical protein